MNIGTAALVSALCLADVPASAQDYVVAFYRGRIVVGSAAGGGYELLARIVARHIGAHIPGHHSAPTSWRGCAARWRRRSNFLAQGMPRRHA